MLSIHPLTDVVGARIEGIDLSQPINPDDFHVPEEALHTHGFIVLKKQSLTPRGLAEFGRCWGRPQPHVIDTCHHSEDANVLVLSNVHKDGKPTGLVDAGTYFHSDYSYLAQPARCTILHARDVPAGRNGTTFANQRRACADLSATKRQQIEGMVVRHHYGNRDDLDKHCYTNEYENGDVIVWDNALLLHSAPLIDLSRPRTLWRVTSLYQ